MADLTVGCYNDTWQKSVQVEGYPLPGERGMPITMRIERYAWDYIGSLSRNGQPVSAVVKCASFEECLAAVEKLTVKPHLMDGGWVKFL